MSCLFGTGTDFLSLCLCSAHHIMASNVSGNFYTNQVTSKENTYEFISLVLQFRIITLNKYVEECVFLEKAPAPSVFGQKSKILC